MKWEGPLDVADAWTMAWWAVKAGDVPHPSKWVDEWVARAEAEKLASHWSD